MFNLILIEYVATIQVDAVYTEKLAKTFLKFANTDFCYVLSGKRLLGAISRERFMAAPRHPLRILPDIHKYVCENTDDVFNEDNEKKLSDLFFSNPSIKEIAIIDNDYNLLGLARQTVSDASQEIQTLLCRLLDLTQRDKHCIGSWCLRNNVKKVSVYSEGNLTVRRERDLLDTILIRELLCDERIQMEYLITQTITTIENVITVRPREIEKSRNIEVDLVIAPFPNSVRKVKHIFSGFSSKTRVVSLSEIINDIWNSDYCDKIVETLYSLTKRGISCLFVAAPVCDLVNNPSEWEKYLISNHINSGIITGTILNKTAQINGFQEKYKTAEEYVEKRKKSSTLSQVSTKNYYYHKDTTNLIDNFRGRNVAYRPTKYSYNIFMFGDSSCLGVGLEVEDTCASQLQKLLNSHKKKGIVHNFSANGAKLDVVSNTINDTNISCNDIVIVMMRHRHMFKHLYENLNLNGILCINSQHYFDRPHDYGEIFYTGNHVNWNGNRKIAELIFESLPVSKKDIPGNFLPYYESIPLVSINRHFDEWYDPIAQSNTFRRYIEDLNRLAIENNEVGRVGCIVMNCNPFTLGHQYLIEQSSKKVDFLYIFVVEEDVSFFPFAERIELVRRGTEHLRNVFVLPSGQYIISSLTFPEYFNKDEKQTTVISPSTDVELFAKYIAPSLKITTRFAGEEPLDSVTRQYNKWLARVLPKYGIKFEVIPRKYFNGDIISASRVRAELRLGKFETIENIVPASTLSYLKTLPKNKRGG
jgi:[citrate (pro-3S)-lyase] ligase